MGISLDLKNNFGIDKIYVLSCKSFTDRINHIKNELAKHALDFEFIFEHDIEEVYDNPIVQNKFLGQELTDGHKSLILKHIQAWKNCVDSQYQSIMVLEDDVILDKNFLINLTRINKRSKHLLPGYLIFLSGKDTRVPREFLLGNDILFKNKIPTADGYVTDFLACKKRLRLLSCYLINLPADHLINDLDEKTNTQLYWSRNNLIEQGSVFGLFNSSLDGSRKKHSPLYNYLRYKIKIFTRRFMKKALYIATLQKIK